MIEEADEDDDKDIIMLCELSFRLLLPVLIASRLRCSLVGEQQQNVHDVPAIVPVTGIHEPLLLGPGHGAAFMCFLVSLGNLLETTDSIGTTAMDLIQISLRRTCSKSPLPLAHLFHFFRSKCCCC